MVLGAGAVSLGIIEGAAEAVNSLLKLVSGRASDKAPTKRPLVLLGYSVSSAAKPFIAVATGWLQVFVIRILDRMGKGIRSAPRDAMLASWATPQSRGKVYGFHQAMDNLGAVVGPVLATLFLLAYPSRYRTLFALTIIPGAIAVTLIFFVPESAAESSAAGTGAPSERSPRSSAEEAASTRMPREFTAFMLVLSLFMLGNSTDAFLLLKLTDAAGTGQTRFDPLIDNNNPNAEYARADFDTAQVFNLNTIYELPFGRGRRWLNSGNGFVDRLVSGWEVTSIIRASVGAPILITDNRGTLNRAGRSARQTPQTNLTLPQLKALLGVFQTPCGVFGIDPNVINIDLAKCQQGIRASRVAGLNAGIGAAPFGSAPFPGEVFFLNGPGQTGNLPRNFDNGPIFFNWDASIIKNIRLTEKTHFQLRAEAFNVLNHANFFYAGNDVSSTSFGRITSTFTSSSAQRVIQFVGRFEF